MSIAETKEVLNETTWKTALLHWIKTTRVQTGFVTALALWIGFVSVKPLGFESAILLGVVGFLVHMWGFTLNEVEDYKYDAQFGEANGHPIAQGKVHAGAARYFAWMSAAVAIGISALTPYRIEATVVLLLSFIPGYMYDKFSKQHWWSNVYLSVWAGLMVLAGGLYAGLPNTYTYLISIAVSIQIFVQVIEGDLKDIRGSEKTLPERLGVKVNVVEGRAYNAQTGVPEHTDKSSDVCEVVSYSSSFTYLVYGLKLLEVGILSYIALTAVHGSSRFPLISEGMSAGYYALMLILIVSFMTTISMFLVYCYDRDEIKKKSSAHELLSIMLLGAAVAPIHLYSAFLISGAPILWYITVNYLVHSNALNPDI